MAAAQRDITDGVLKVHESEVLRQHAAGVRGPEGAGGAVAETGAPKARRGFLW